MSICLITAAKQQESINVIAHRVGIVIKSDKQARLYLPALIRAKLKIDADTRFEVFEGIDGTVCFKPL